MKRILIATILGIASCATPSFGQAAFFFSNYIPINASPVLWNPQWIPEHAGQPVPDGTLTDIIWSYGSTTGDAGLAIPTQTIPGYGPGWIIGPSVSTAANYASGPITFTILVWRGGPSYGSFLNVYQDSLTWTEVNGFIAGGPPDFFNNYPGWPVPEPSVATMAGLAVASLLISRRTAKPVLKSTVDLR